MNAVELLRKNLALNCAENYFSLYLTAQKMDTDLSVKIFNEAMLNLSTKEQDRFIRIQSKFNANKVPIFAKYLVLETKETNYIFTEILDRYVDYYVEGYAANFMEKMIFEIDRKEIMIYGACPFSPVFVFNTNGVAWACGNDEEKVERSLQQSYTI